MIGYCSVTIYFDPLNVDAAWLEAEVRACAGSLDVEDAAEGAVVDVPVCYGGDLGPDLGDVAAFAGCSEAEVIDLHAGREYRVYMVGFVPGFAYMAEVEPRIAAPRRASPRTAVPAGSVAIAGGQTGVYPAVTPGGWNIIGRTALHAVRSGSRAAVPVQVRRPRAVSADGSPESFLDRDAAPSRVVRPGMLTTIQDLGRWGFQANGVPVAGPMDEYSHALANQLVGNTPTAAAIEVTLIGPELQANGEVVVRGRGCNVRADGWRRRRADAQRVHPPTGRAPEVWRAIGRRSSDARGAGRDRCAAGVRQPRHEPHQPHGPVWRTGAEGR